MEGQQTAEASARTHLRIFQINDVYELDYLPHFHTLVKDLSAGIEHTLVILAGDFLAPSLLSSLDKGRGMVDILNACSVTHVCIGNHETDVSPQALAQRIRESKFCWINTNMRELDTLLDVKTEPYVMVQVGDKKVALLGLLTDDPSLYFPTSFAGAKIDPIISTTKQYLQTIQSEEQPDLFVPMTHQRMPEDREFAETFADVFPVVLGGHDHEPYDETIRADSGACSRILKTGCDAHTTAVIDIIWNDGKDNASGGAAGADKAKSHQQPTINVDFVPTKTYAADPAIQRRVEGHERILSELEKAKLFRISDWMKKSKVGEGVFGTKSNRLGPSNGSRVLIAMLRMAMRSTCAIFNAGSIRGNKVYDDQEWFAWSDLKSEIPFHTMMTAVYLPGKVLQDTILHSRRFIYEHNPPVASGGYLHACDNIDWDYDTNTIRSIAGEPFDAEKQYLTAMPCDFFAGMDNHEPLLEWSKLQPRSIVNLEDLHETGREAKLLLVEMFSALIWLEMGSFESIDTNNDGYLTHEEIKARSIEVFGEDVSDIVVDSIMNVADLDNTGRISPLDMMVVQFVATDMIDHVCTHEELCVMKDVAIEVLGDNIASHDQLRSVVEKLKDVLDITGDGSINRKEAMQALGEVKRRSLL